MRRIFLALALVALATGSAAASDKTDVMAVVNQFTDSFNNGDTKGYLATCSDQTSVLDEFPPYEWHGAGACAAWSADFEADAKKNGITEGKVKLHSPWTVDISGTLAYVVVPADYSYKMHGKPIKETASVLAVVLKKGPSGWRIAASSWSKH